MNARSDLATSNPLDESELAHRLLVALAECDSDAITRLQGTIFGLHFGKLRAYVSARMDGVSDNHAEEVFGEAAEKMLLTLLDPERVERVKPGNSFAPLFFTIAKREVANYWRGRPPYKEDRRPIETNLTEKTQSIATAENPYEKTSHFERAEALMEALGGIQGFDGLLLELTVMSDIRLKDVEQLLPLAEAEDAAAATASAAALLDIHPILAEQYLTLIRECPSARPMSYNALKVAVHRARRRALGSDPGIQVVA
jgi:DNA-directed RNA polymerase specialized sigma24 family protein